MMRIARAKVVGRACIVLPSGGRASSFVAVEISLLESPARGFDRAICTPLTCFAIRGAESAGFRTRDPLVQEEWVGTVDQAAGKGEAARLFFLRDLRTLC
jgi:hypothetical protein